MKTWVFHFEGQIEVEAETQDNAVDKALSMIHTGDIGWWECNESDPDHVLTTF